MVNIMDLVCNNIKMEQNIKANLEMMNMMESGKKFIPMVLIMKEDFRKGSIMDMGFGIIIMEIN